MKSLTLGNSSQTTSPRHLCGCNDQAAAYCIGTPECDPGCQGQLHRHWQDLARPRNYLLPLLTFTLSLHFLYTFFTLSHRFSTLLPRACWKPWKRGRKQLVHQRAAVPAQGQHRLSAPLGLQHLTVKWSESATSHTKDCQNPYQCIIWMVPNRTAVKIVT